mmetsp:Transcript_10044/g.36697  ORF Transcript_10044/g.36697 Transcript_10044/m.36697 type:complete len:208 (+) Transcript_10044:806-1429(+)
MLLWLTMRASPLAAAAFEMSGNSSLVSRKCDRWLTCICTSYPSAVATSFIAITPALLHSTSMLPSLPSMLFTWLAASRTDWKLCRSQSTPSTVASGKAARQSSRNLVARSDLRLRQITRAPLSSSTREAILPQPVVVPVSTTVLPSMDGSPATNLGNHFVPLLTAAGSVAAGFAAAGSVGVGAGCSVVISSQADERSASRSEGTVVV